VTTTQPRFEELVAEAHVGWYDFSLTAADDQHFGQRLAGRFENGDDSISDPAMGGLL
jgi:phospholipase C